MNDTEKLIVQFSQSLKVRTPDELSTENISNQLSVEVLFWDRSSAVSELNGIYKVFINENLSEQGQWQDFGHEMSHYFGDGSRSVLRENYVDYCESKADYFAYHFCVPTFMLLNLEEVTVYDVMDLFNVEFNFAYRRLEMYKNKVLERKIVHAGTYN